jgi:hypothetical protein
LVEGAFSDWASLGTRQNFPQPLTATLPLPPRSMGPLIRRFRCHAPAPLQQALASPLTPSFSDPCPRNLISVKFADNYRHSEHNSFMLEKQTITAPRRRLWRCTRLFLTTNRYPLTTAFPAHNGSMIRFVNSANPAGSANTACPLTDPCSLTPDPCSPIPASPTPSPLCLFFTVKAFRINKCPSKTGQKTSQKGQKWSQNIQNQSFFEVFSRELPPCGP